MMTRRRTIRLKNNQVRARAFDHGFLTRDICALTGNIHADESLALLARVSDLVFCSCGNCMEEALTDERFGRFMERIVFFTLDETCFMGEVRTPDVSTPHHHLTVTTKAKIRASALGGLYMHCLIRLGVCYRV